MDDSSSQRFLDGFPVIRTASELEDLLTPWHASLASPCEPAGETSAQQRPLAGPELPPPDAPPCHGPASMAPPAAWIRLSAPLLPAAFLLERAPHDASPVGRVAQALSILCEALATGCFETLLRGYQMLQQEVDPGGARQRRWLQPSAPNARTPFYVLQEVPREARSAHSGCKTAAEPGLPCPPCAPPSQTEAPACVEALPDEGDV